MGQNFPHNIYPSYGSTKQYQGSTIPYLTSSLTVPATGSAPITCSFPQVSQWIVIKNELPTTIADVPMKYGFSVLGTHGATTTNFMVLNNQEHFAANWKVTNVYLISSGSAEATGSVFAGLTAIESKELPDNHSGSTGVG